MVADAGVPQKLAPDSCDSRRSSCDGGPLEAQRLSWRGTLLSQQNGRESAPRASTRRSVSDEKKLDEIKTVFVDAAAMKEKVRQNLNRPVVSVTDLYKSHGACQHIARSSSFTYSSLCVITLNALWIAVDTDYNNSEILTQAHPVFQTAEHMFCAYFFLEWAVKFGALRRKRDVLKDNWFTFDSALVLMMVLETWVMTAVVLISGGKGEGLGNASIMRIARLLRLSRMARMARLLRSIPELMILVKGMFAACRSVFFTLCLLAFLTYVFAIAFAQLTEGTNVGEQHFSSVLESMYTLSLYGTLLDSVGVLAGRLKRESIVYVGLLLVFILLASLTVLNMLVGVLCEVVSAVAATEKEEMLVGYVNRKVKTIVQELDTDGDNSISKTEFIKILENWDAVKALQEVGVDVVGLVDFADVIFEDGAQELSFEKFMDVVLQLRGSNTATVKDIVELRKLVRTNNMQTHQMLARLEGRVTAEVTKTGHMTPLSTLASTCDPVDLEREKQQEGLFVESFPMPPLSSLSAPLLKPESDALSEHSGTLENHMQQMKVAPVPQSHERQYAFPEQLPRLQGSWSPCMPGEGVHVCRALLEHISLVGRCNSAESHGYRHVPPTAALLQTLKEEPCRESNWRSRGEAMAHEGAAGQHDGLSSGPVELKELKSHMATLGKALSASLCEVHKLCEDLAPLHRRSETLLAAAAAAPAPQKALPGAATGMPAVPASVCHRGEPHQGHSRTEIFVPTFDLGEEELFNNQAWLHNEHLQTQLFRKDS